MKTKTSIYHHTFAFAYVLLVAVLFTGCANVTPIEACINHTPYGFWGGLWLTVYFCGAKVMSANGTLDGLTKSAENYLERFLRKYGA